MAEESDRMTCAADQPQPYQLPGTMHPGGKPVFRQTTIAERIAGYQADGTPVFVPVTEMKPGGDAPK